ncbi:MAG: ECF transporter S component [Dethiobacter sp.]|jgi:uncharacterized membrane protein|nr:ECF transporter S component [Dethiobacter sp.]
MNLTIRKIVMSGILGAVSILLGVTGLGFIPVPTPAGHATIMHVPAILGGVLEGPIVGLLTGAIFGIFSFLRATSPLFTDPLVAIFPRLFIGVTAYYTFAATKRFNPILAYILAGVVGTATNTILVLGMATVRGFLPASVAVSVGVLHGVPEIIVAAILVVVLCKGIQRVRGIHGNEAEEVKEDL